MNNWLQRFRGSATTTQSAAEQRPAASASQRTSTGTDHARSHFETRYVVINTEASSLNVDRAQLLGLATLGISEARLGTIDSHCCKLGRHQPSVCLLDTVNHIAQSPLVAFNAAFNRSVFERALQQHLNRSLEVPWIDLYFVLPALFPERHERPVRLDHWIQSFAIETIPAPRALADGWAIAQLFLAALARASAHGAHTPRALIDIERLQRQYRTRL